MRERVLLFGDTDARPDGLERALVRAGFSLAEGASFEPQAPPDIALVAVRDAGSGLESALAAFRGTEWAGVQVVALLATPSRDGVARALSLGAADALAAPVDLAELAARLVARLRSRNDMQRAAGAGSLHSELLHAIEEVAGARRPEEMLETLVRRLGAALGVAHCACLEPSSDRRHARLVAVHENPTLRDVAVDLFRYPEAVEAAVSSRTVHAPEVLRDGLFLAHLAQWPDSPEVHEIESAAAVPLITNRTVRAVVVLRTRRGEPALTQEHVAQVERLVNSTAALLEREERRAGAARRQTAPSSVDPLTGCASLDALDRRLREELERVRRYGSELTVAILELDAPRGAGDRLLAELGALLSEEIRTPDFVARYIGGEFALLLPSTGVAGARRVLGRIAARVRSHPFRELAEVGPPHLAAGIVVFPHAGVTRAEDLLAAAEAALATGKLLGLDGVGVAGAAAA
jgi:diguanylate cyclase (GGDEF)-like protein